VTERLIIENLGPVGKLEIEPRRLTLLIGEQASGKSLVAQLLYFFRGLEYQLARIYNPDLVLQEDWHPRAVKMILDGLRAVPFEVFSNGTACLTYTPESAKQTWEVTVGGPDGAVRLSDNLSEQLEKWVEPWYSSPDTLTAPAGLLDRIFIPTERLIYARLYRKHMDALFASDQPELLRRFARLMYETGFLVSPQSSLSFPQGPGNEEPDSEWQKWENRRVKFIRGCQVRAVGGTALPEEQAPHKWKWFMKDGEQVKTLPMEAAASGQTETWPFFALAEAFTGLGKDKEFYFEEPEAHLHPRAQREVMKAVGYLVNLGHPFVITTHSPFIGYVVDNMLQRYISYKGKVPEDQIGLNPEEVAAYRLRQRPEDHPEDIMDRKDTKLINLEELESVADELGGEFDQLLDMTE
jgi:hypothetical protein